MAWFPRLAHGTAAERTHWRLIGRGEGIHWPDLDEDISVESLLAGRASGETQASLAGRRSGWRSYQASPPVSLRRISARSLHTQRPLLAPGTWPAL